MKTLLLSFILPFICAASTDDQSLMQQGVGIESGVLASSVEKASVWKANLDTIQTALDEIPHPGKMRQMAIDALMQSVSQGEEIVKQTQCPDPTDATGCCGYEPCQLLRQVIELLWDILNSWENQINLETQQLEAIATAITACNTASVDDTDSKEEAANNASTDHENCRTAELTLRVAARTDCTDLQAITTNYRTGAGTYAACEVYSGYTKPTDDSTSSKIEEVWNQNGGATLYYLGNPMVHVEQYTNQWYNYWDYMNTYWQDASDDYDAAYTLCETAVDLWTDKRTVCQGYQVTYEAAHCTWKSARDGMCSGRASCYSTQSDLWDQKYAEILRHDATRVAMAHVIQRCICLLDIVASAQATATTLTDSCPLDDNATEILAAMTDQHEPKRYEDNCTGPAAPHPLADGVAWDNAKYATTISAWSDEFLKYELKFDDQTDPVC